MNKNISTFFFQKNVENFNLIKANRSVPLAYIQYVTAMTVIGGAKTYQRIKNLIEGYLNDFIT